MSEIAAIRSAWARKYVFDRPGEMVRDQDADMGLLLARIEVLERMTWECGCGWVNGVNLSECAQCHRTPRDLAALAAEEKR